ncbi:hypothetical protein [Candidatus Viridilinea mediisalina]|uniref:Uncharacterized protein n=1 Tax=Candidatus Viridilinea mediisalina TaxID=2024553 RepID=A0A2A6RPY1_9CHLR|nr:hypothetical protein [Candidatus Viridilinea mediisalina]PDW05122.1 hypothetical protein CJ255_00585 [Candidatus Viridilinea mediisalina]
MSTRQTMPTPEPIDDDLEALTAEIAATTGASAEAARQLAIAQRPALLQYAQQWDAAARTTRPRGQTTPATTDPA